MQAAAANADMTNASASPPVAEPQPFAFAAPFPTPRTPPTAGKRCVVRPMLLQRRGQTPNGSLSASARNGAHTSPSRTAPTRQREEAAAEFEEGDDGASARRAAHGPPQRPHAPSPPADGGRYEEETNVVRESDTCSATVASPSQPIGRLGSPLSASCSRAAQAAAPRPAVTPSLASTTSDLSFSLVPNSSASNSFYGSLASPPPRRGHGAAPYPTATPLSTGGKAVPLLLRTAPSTPATTDDAATSPASRSTSRCLGGGAALPGPHPPLGTPPPSGPPSVSSGTPMSSNRSSAHPSFTRPASSLRAGHAVHGRVLGSPLGARRPDPSTRRTTFQRSASNVSLCDPSAGRPAPLAGHDTDGSGDAAAARGPQRRPSASLPAEMRSFVLGQYRTLQREVVARPTPAPEVVDVSAPTFQHTCAATCPVHSKAARRARLKAEEEGRLRVLQQQHHDLEVIRNGGRERVGEHMKSSFVLAGSLSKLRARTRSVLGSGSVATDRSRTSMELSMSGTEVLAGSPPTPFLGSPDDRDATALYGGPVTPERGEDAAPPPSPEAWHVSKAFMPAGGGHDAAQRGPATRNVNRNGMKGEAIVVAVLSDSDDDEGGTTTARTTRGNSGVGAGLRGGEAAAKQAGERLASQPQRRPASATPSLARRPRSSGGGDDTSSDDETCFSFNTHRSRRVRNAPSLSSTQPLDTAGPTTAPRTDRGSEAVAHSPDVPSRGHSRTTTALLPESDSSESDDVGGSETTCCHCCPCRRPENFLALCRTSSHSATSPVWPDGSDAATEAASGAVAAPPPASWDTLQRAPRPPRPSGAPLSAPVRAAIPAGGSPPVVVEDLEGSDDDEEPTLSMQSFRRASIQRIR